MYLELGLELISASDGMYLYLCFYIDFLILIGQCACSTRVCTQEWNVGGEVGNGNGDGHVF